MAPPTFAAALANLSKEDRKSAIRAVHADYAARVGTWQIQEDAYEGKGGFSDGSYLWRYPAEGDGGWGSRQKMARYHNYTGPIVDIYDRHLFARGITRSCKDQAYIDWADNIDGRGQTLTDLLKRACAMGLMTGHVGILLDKDPTPPAGPARVDDVGRVRPLIFTATAIPDWRYIGDSLQAVKLIEAEQSTDILGTPDETDDEDTARRLVWTVEGWARFDSAGTLIAGDTPPLGLVPFVVLRVKRATSSQMVGRALLGDANIVRGIYNRCSEEDEVLRNQAFSLLTVSVPNDGDVESTRAQIGNVIGAAKAIVAKGTIDYKTPNQDIPGVIRGSKNDLIAALYRAAHIRQPRESAQIETAEAIKLQNDELNEVLADAARTMAQVEREVARAWFAWTRATPEQAQAEFEKAEFSATYPSQFFLESVADELAEIEQGIALNLGQTMTTRLKMRAVRRLDPDIAPDEMQKIEKEVEAASATPDPLDTGQDDPNADDPAADDDPEAAAA